MKASEARLLSKAALPRTPRTTHGWRHLLVNPIRFRTLIVTQLLPSRKWYGAALKASRFETLLEGLIPFRKRSKGHATRLHSWIRDLTELGPFPVPLRVLGLNIVAERLRDGGGLLLCSTHIPLVDLAVTALVDSGHSPDLIVSAEHNMLEGRYQIPTTSGSLRAVIAGPKAFLRVRTKLREGGLVICLLDRRVDGPLSDNPLRLAAKLLSPVAFWSVKLQSDMVIEVEFETAPYPLCETDEAIRANLTVAESRRTALMNC